MYFSKIKKFKTIKLVKYKNIKNDLEKKNYEKCISSGLALNIVGLRVQPFCETRFFYMECYNMKSDVFICLSMSCNDLIK